MSIFSHHSQSVVNRRERRVAERVAMGLWAFFGAVVATFMLRGA